MVQKLFAVGLVVVGLVVAAVFFTRRNAVVSAEPVNTPYTLDDSTPSIDVVVNSNNGASGVVYVELSGARASLKNGTQAEMLSTNNSTAQAIAIQVAVGAAPQTLQLERLSGVAVAHVLVSTQAVMPSSTTNATGSTVSTVSLTTTAAIPITVTADANLLNVQLPAQQATLQLVDAQGSTVLNAQTSKDLSSIAVKLKPGQYTLSLSDPDTSSQAMVSLSSAPVSTLPQAIPANTSAQDPQAAAVNITACSAVLNASATLYSGPGTGYSVIGNAATGDILPVGGINPQQSWILVQVSGGSGWINAGLAAPSGKCDGLKVYNIPLRNATIRPAQPANPALPAGRDDDGREYGENVERD